LKRNNKGGESHPFLVFLMDGIPFILCAVEFISRRDLLMIEFMYQHDPKFTHLRDDAILTATSNKRNSQLSFRICPLKNEIKM